MRTSQGRPLIDALARAAAQLAQLRRSWETGCRTNSHPCGIGKVIDYV
jgi:hypothetical protein